MLQESGGIYLNREEQAEILARMRRIETILYKLMIADGVEPREENAPQYVQKDNKGNKW